MAVWLRLTWLFGLPDDVEQTGNLTMDALGPLLRAATTHIVDAPLPPQLSHLLTRLQRRERTSARRAALDRRRSSATSPEPIALTAAAATAQRGRSGTILVQPQ
jgi:hypothetical protein